MRSPPNLLPSREKRLNAFSLSSYSRFSSPFTVALLGSLSSLSMSFLTCGDQNWRHHSRGGLEDGFLSQATEKPTRRGALLDLPLTSKDELVGDEKAEGSLGCSDHGMVELKILRGRWAKKQDHCPGRFKGEEFGLFRNLLGRMPRDTARREVGSRRAG